MNIINIIKEEIQKFLNEYLDVNKLPDIPINLPITMPNTKTFKDVSIENDSVKVLDPNFMSYKKFDFVVLPDGTLNIGNGHYRISGKAANVKAAGEIMFDDYGKIIYLSNESGHYKPTEKNLNDITDLFKKYNLVNPEYHVKHQKYYN
jgi:hypothetical protein